MSERVPAQTSPDAPAAPLLEVRALTRRFGNRTAVDGVSLAIGPGEIFGLLGPNGAGKTTIFHLLTGLLLPHGGEFFFDGRPVQPSDQRMRADTGVVFQKPSIDAKLTGRENLELGAALYAVPRALAKPRVREALAQSGLSERADEPVEHYSGGMRRRLELARVLLGEPRLLILDEPTQGLDQAAFRRFWSELLVQRRERGLTILLTSHHPDEAEYCDRLAILDAGKVIACDTPERLREQVGGDVLVVGAQDAETLAGEIAKKFSVTPRVLGGEIRFETERGHELIPRLVEAFPAGRLASVAMHRPTLADVFVKLTGRSLDVENGDAGAGQEAA